MTSLLDVGHRRPGQPDPPTKLPLCHPPPPPAAVCHDQLAERDVQPVGAVLHTRFIAYDPNLAHVNVTNNVPPVNTYTPLNVSRVDIFRDPLVAFHVARPAAAEQDHSDAQPAEPFRPSSLDWPLPSSPAFDLRPDTAVAPPTQGGIRYVHVRQRRDCGSRRPTQHRHQEVHLAQVHLGGRGSRRGGQGLRLRTGWPLRDIAGRPLRLWRQSRKGAALLRRRPKGLLPAARQELLDPSKAWWGGRRGRLADRPRYSISVSLGVVPRWYSRVVEVPVRIEVAAGFVAPGASEPPRLQPSWPPGGFGPAHG